MKRHFHNKKIKGVWKRRDYLILIAILIAIGSGLAALKVGQGVYRDNKLSRYDRKAHVKIDKITPVRQHALRSSEIVTHAYDVKFRYIVKGELFEKSEFIPNTLENTMLLDSLYGESRSIVFRYDSSNPKKGLLDVKRD